MTSLVPKDFEVPAGFETPDFRVRMLAISDVVKDYDAVMTSVERLQKVFSPAGRWPHGLTFEQDLIDLGWHHKEFQLRRSFAYTVMSLDEAMCLGCLYIEPTTLPGYDAEVHCWVRTSHAEALDPRLYQSLRDWIARRWPFKAVAYPGRALTWEQVAALRQVA
ncbi:MAG TPA: GNAT family N-acetyltransferase [Burkholderiaceae bacterium]|nr:GNAT family N-acetyltransferase [Burkholderiaceae bacterium]